MVFLPLPEAAARLGLSQSALRRRLRSGGAQGERRPSPGGFTWWVGVDAPTPPPPPTPGGGGDEPGVGALAEAVRRLEAHNASLTEELAARRREVAELHVTVNRLVLALPPPAIATNGVSHDHIQDDLHDHIEPGEAVYADGLAPQTQGGAAPGAVGRRRWWQRLLWG